MSRYCVFESLESRRFMSADLVSIAELIGLNDSEHSDILENVGISAERARSTRDAQPAQADARVMAFEVDGIWAATGFPDPQHIAGTVRGDSTLGEFTGTYLERWGGDRRVGSATMNFAHGSLTVNYDYRHVNPTDTWRGTWVASSGTGSLARATAAGEIIVIEGTTEPTGPFFLSGTLTR